MNLEKQHDARRDQDRVPRNGPMTRSQLRVANALAWGGPVALAATCLGWLICGILPLPNGPADSPAEILDFVAGHQTRYLAGMVLASLGVCFMLLPAAVASLHMARAEGKFPVLAALQLAAAATTMIINFVPHIIWAVNGYRPELRDSGSVVFVNDLGWMLLFTGAMPFIFQNLAIAVSILTNPESALPRWFAWLNIFVATSFLPDPLAYFFYDGPIAWNGVIVFWLALTTYGVFLVTLCVVLLRANRQLFDQSQATMPEPVAA
jgi:hypothetical protein